MIWNNDNEICNLLKFDNGYLVEHIKSKLKKVNVSEKKYKILILRYGIEDDTIMDFRAIGEKMKMNSERAKTLCLSALKCLEHYN